MPKFTTYIAESRVVYMSIDGCKVVSQSKTLEGLRIFCRKYVGAHPEFGMGYAVSGDGVGKIVIENGYFADEKQIALSDLFPEPPAAMAPSVPVEDQEVSCEIPDHVSEYDEPAPYGL